MNDQQWLERITIAYKVYAKDVRPDFQIEQFIDWLYQQYGIVKPNEKK